VSQPQAVRRARHERTFAPLASATRREAHPEAPAARTPPARWQRASATTRVRRLGLAERLPTPVPRTLPRGTGRSRRRCALWSAALASASNPHGSACARTRLNNVFDAHVRRRARVGAQPQLVDTAVAACRDNAVSCGRQPSKRVRRTETNSEWLHAAYGAHGIAERATSSGSHTMRTSAQSAAVVERRARLYRQVSSASPSLRAAL
jgi:hypothetical protein